MDIDNTTRRNNWGIVYPRSSCMMLLTLFLAMVFSAGDSAFANSGAAQRASRQRWSENMWGGDTAGGLVPSETALFSTGRPKRRKRKPVAKESIEQPSREESEKVEPGPELEAGVVDSSSELVEVAEPGKKISLAVADAANERATRVKLPPLPEDLSSPGVSKTDVRFLVCLCGVTCSRRRQAFQCLQNVQLKTPHWV